MESRAVVEALIAEVKKRTCLWNKQDDYYKNRIHVDKMWDEVAEVTNKSKDQIKIKWRNLRDQFHREVRKLPVSEPGSPQVDQYSGKWIYFELLTFLIGHISAKPPGEFKPDDEREDYSLLNDENIEIVIKKDPDFDEEIHFENDNFLDPLHPYENTSDSDVTTVVEPHESSRKRISKGLKRKKPTHAQRQIGAKKRRTQSADLVVRDVDDDVHFALSLVPYLRKLGPLRKLIVRNEMQNLLIGELVSEAQTSCKPTNK